MSAGTMSRSFFDAAGRRYAPVAAILFFGVEPVVVESIVRRGGPGSGRGHTLKGEMAVKTQKLERGYIYSRNLMCKVGAAKNAPTKNYITVFPRSYACLHHEQRGAWSVGSLLFT